MAVKISFQQTSKILTDGLKLGLTLAFQVERVRFFDTETIKEGNKVKRLVLQCDIEQQFDELRKYADLGMLGNAIIDQVWDEENKVYKHFELGGMQFDQFEVESV